MHAGPGACSQLRLNLGTRQSAVAVRRIQAPISAAVVPASQRTSLQLQSIVPLPTTTVWFQVGLQTSAFLRDTGIVHVRSRIGQPGRPAMLDVAATKLATTVLASSSAALLRGAWIVH